MSTLYTFGYLSTKSTRILSELIAVKTPIIDIRFHPESKRYQWKKEALQKKLGTQYTWLQELGNEWYKQALTGAYTEPHIKLHAPDEGMVKLQNILIVRISKEGKRDNAIRAKARNEINEASARNETD
jgi:hypothetical protein